MTLLEIAQRLEATGLGSWVRETVGVAPLISATHILAIGFVFGTICTVDLRLLGLAFKDRPITSVSQDLLRWTWVAFVLATITGLMMFLANATVFERNVPFWLKMGAIALAGMNMFYFERVTFKSVSEWNNGVVPARARLAGGISLTLWISVVVLGRFIGYTKGSVIPVADPSALGNFF